MAVPPKHLAVAGSVNADLVFSLQRVPKAGETLAARSLTVHPGGKVGEMVLPAAAARLPPTHCLCRHWLLTPTRGVASCREAIKRLQPLAWDMPPS
jgi:hypothetical protein